VEAGLKRNRKVYRGLVLTLVLLLLAWTNAAAIDWTVTTDSASDRETAVSSAPSIENSTDGADSEDVRPPSHAGQPELPAADLDNGVPSYVPAITLGLTTLTTGVPQIRLGTSAIDVSPYLQPK
jgi:hypothetical protein